MTKQRKSEGDSKAKESENRTSAEFVRQIPPVHFDAELPVSQRVSDIRDIISKNRVTIVCGETGSGKSTQLPKLLLDMGYGREKRIGHTQPRRIAARSVAARVAEEVGTPLGETVGYKIRFGDKTSNQTAIKMMTDGILLAEVPRDRWLNQYDAIILDEVHERSLNIDLLIGILKRITQKRSDLRLVITSATIDADRIAEHFSYRGEPAPIVEVSGRTFPVDIVYRPLEEDDPENESTRDVFAAIGDAVIELNRTDRGDILVFLPTEQDIRLATKHLRGLASQNRIRNTEVLPLYARLSGKDQNKIFHPGKQARVILATNVAESSLTVPRIKHVIDTGTARMSRYSPKSKVQRLPIESVSQASANQRAGRCGRLEPGICIRLYSEADFLSRDEFTTPEIRRTNLASVILQAKTMRLGEIEQISFIDPPRTDSIRDGYKTLFEVGAVDDHRKLTPLGKKISRLPIDPRLARMIIAADDEGCLADILVIAAALEVRDPRDRPAEKRKAADEAHGKFKDAESDFNSLLKMWDFIGELKESLSHSKFRKACAQNFLSFNRVREWQDVQRQLRKITHEIGFKVGGRSNDYGKIHRALLTGLLSGVAFKGEKFEFTGAGGGKFFLWPGSGLFGKPSKWIVASELVETEKRYLRNVAKIDPGWIERIAAHLVKRNYSDPHFSSKTGSCMAYEKVLLFGMPVVSGRRINYGKIDPVVSREIFIEKGLVEQGYTPQQGVIAENNQLIDSLGSLANKTRDRELVLDPLLVSEFYEKRIPEHVCDARLLQRYFKDASKEDRDALRMKADDLIAGSVDDCEEQFPDELPVGGLNVPLEYRFEPGASADGVTLRIPTEAIRQLNPRQLDWLVPGMIEQKITAMIRCLPKSLRRNLVPAPDTAKSVASQLDYGKGVFAEVVALHLTRIGGEPIQASDFQSEKIDKHFQINIEVTDPEGETVASGRDLVALRGELGGDGQSETGQIAIAVENETWNRSELKEWDFDKLPKQIEISRQPISVFAYPALIDRSEHVDLALLDSKSLAKYETTRGITRLAWFAAKKQVRSQVRWLPNLDQVKLHAATLMNSDALDQQINDLLTRRAFVDGGKLPRTREEFQQRIDEAAQRTSVAAQDIARILPKLFDALHQVLLRLEERDIQARPNCCEDVRQQIAELTRDNFLVETPWRWLGEMPRFFNAILQRFEKLPRLGAEDTQIAAEIAEYTTRYSSRKQENATMGIVDPELETFRWMLEEYRVSRFAQTLGTSISVSPQRLEKQWDKAMRSIAGV